MKKLLPLTILVTLSTFCKGQELVKDINTTPRSPGRIHGIISIEEYASLAATTFIFSVVISKPVAKYGAPTEHREGTKSLG